MAEQKSRHAAIREIDEEALPDRVRVLLPGGSIMSKKLRRAQAKKPFTNEPMDCVVEAAAQAPRGNVTRTRRIRGA